MTALPMSERDLQDAVVDCARRLGWLCAHFRAAQIRAGRYATPVAYDGAGFVDLVLARRGRVIFAEVKRDGQKPRPEQRAWLDALAPEEGSVGGPVTVLVIQPRHWLSGEVEELLR